MPLTDEEKTKIIEEERVRAQARAQFTEANKRKGVSQRELKHPFLTAIVIIAALIAVFAFLLSGGDEDEKTAGSAPEQASVVSSSHTNLNPEEQAYFDDITPIISDHSNSFSGLSEILNTGSSPLLWTDKQKLTVAAHLGVIIASHERALKITPPLRFQTAHDKLLAAFESHREAARLFARGLDATDGNLIEQATTKLMEGIVQIREAKDELNELTQE